MPNSLPDSKRLSSRRRTLTDSERRSLRGKLGHLRAQGRRASRVSLWLAPALFFLFWVLTLLASDVSWIFVTGFWFVVGAGISAWVRRDLSREVGEASGLALGLESALRRNEADVFDVRASSYVELEEVEDEGACFAFELIDGGIAFLSGQEFYPGAGFPSLDFSLVFPLDEEGRAVDMLIEKRGSRARPTRTIPSKVKWEMALPESLSVVQGSLDDLEEILRPRG